MIATIAAAVLMQAPQPMGRPDTHTLGKTCKEVVLMGRDRWFEHFTAEVGETTLDMTTAERTFGLCRRTINDERLRSSRANVSKELVQQLRKELDAAGESGGMVGMSLSGGGTLWNLIFSGVIADTEEVVDALIRRDEEPTNVLQAEIWSDYKRLKAKLNSRRSQINESSRSSGVTYEEASAKLDSIVSSFSRMVPRIKNMGYSDRSWIMKGYVEALRHADFMSEDE